MSATPASSRFPSYPAQRLTIHFGARDHDHHGSLLVHLMKRARKVKLAGATAFEAYEGYGASGLLHRTHSLSDDAPVTIMIIDRAERVEAFLLEAKDLLESVLVTIADLEVLEL